MPQTELPREAWAAFLDDLSRDHETGLVTVEVRGDGLPQQVAVREQPLIGISYEEKGSGAGRVVIMTGEDEDDAASHTVARPVIMTVETIADDVDNLRFDSGPDQPLTIVRFISAT